MMDAVLTFSTRFPCLFELDSRFLGADIWCTGLQSQDCIAAKLCGSDAALRPVRPVSCVPVSHHKPDMCNSARLSVLPEQQGVKVAQTMVKPLLGLS